VEDLHDRALRVAKLDAITPRTGVLVAPEEVPPLEADVVDELPMVSAAHGLSDEAPDHDFDRRARRPLRAGFARGSRHRKSGLQIEP
jgi:hypothetical protein